MKRRQRAQRIDDERRRNHVKAARRLIFENGDGVNSEHIKRILNEESLVPTLVSHLLCKWSTVCLRISCRMPFPSVLQNFYSISLSCSLWTFSMSSSLEFGRQSLLI